VKTRAAAPPTRLLQVLQSCRFRAAVFAARLSTDRIPLARDGGVRSISMTKFENLGGT
jgi:hypothetical protein